MNFNLNKLLFLPTFDIILFLLIASVFLGSQIYLFDLGAFHLLPSRLFMLIAFVLVLFGLCKYGYIRWTGKRIKWLIYFYLFWLFWSFISVLWSADIAFWFKQFISHLTGVFLILLFVNAVDNEDKLKTSIYIIMFMYIVVIVAGIMETVGGICLFAQDVRLEPIYGLGPFVYIPKTFWNNRNDFATVLAIYCPFLLTNIDTKEINKRIRYLFIIIIAITFTFLIVTDSRANIFAFLLSLALFLLISANRSTLIKRIVLLLISVSVLSMFIPMIWGYLQMNVSSVFDVQSYYAQAGSNAVRLNLVEEGLKKLSETYFMGVGCGNSTAYFFSSDVFSRYGIASPHNYWLEIVLDYGLVFLLFYIIFYVVLFINVFIIAIRGKGLLRRTAAALFVILIIFNISNQSSSSVSNELAIFLIFGLCLVVINIYRNRMAIE